KTCSPAATATACSPSTSIRARGSSGATSCRPTAWSALSVRRSGCRGGGIRRFERPRGERQRHPVRPPEAVLRGVLAPAGAPMQVHHVVLLRHLAGRGIGTPAEGEPTVAGSIGEVGAPVAAHPLG